MENMPIVSHFYAGLWATMHVYVMPLSIMSGQRFSVRKSKTNFFFIEFELFGRIGLFGVSETLAAH